MIGIEWEVPTSLTTTAGTLNFNVYPGLVLDPNQCSATKDVRATKEPVPQGNGDIFHRRWLTGYTYKIVATAWHGQDIPACGTNAEEGRLLLEELALHLEAMRINPGRYCWTPTNYGDNRALDQANWLTGVTQSLQNGIWQVEFEIDSPFPYAIDLTQTSPTFTGGTTITNAGNIAFYPVIQVQGPTSTFSIQNNTVTKGIIYDAGRPGAMSIPGGSYAEIDTYKGTIFLNGDGADLSAGIDPTVSDLEDPFSIIPGPNSVDSAGATSVFLMNNSWA